MILRRIIMSNKNSLFELHCKKIRALLRTSNPESLEEVIEQAKKIIQSEEDCRSIFLYDDTITTVQLLEEFLDAFDTSKLLYCSFLQFFCFPTSPWMEKTYVLDLSNIKLRRLPENFRYFSNLRFLYLNNCGLVEFPHLIQGYSNLIDLEICDNLIAQIPTQESIPMSIQYLDISGNPISRIGKELQHLYSLVRFNCSNISNQLVLDKELFSLSSLQEIHLCNIDYLVFEKDIHFCSKELFCDISQSRMTHFLSGVNHIRIDESQILQHCREDVSKSGIRFIEVNNITSEKTLEQIVNLLEYPTIIDDRLFWKIKLWVPIKWFCQLATLKRRFLVDTLDSNVRRYIENNRKQFSLLQYRTFEQLIDIGLLDSYPARTPFPKIQTWTSPILNSDYVECPISVLNSKMVDIFLSPMVKCLEISYETSAYSMGLSPFVKHLSNITELLINTSF